MKITMSRARMLAPLLVLVMIAACSSSGKDSSTLTAGGSESTAAAAAPTDIDERPEETYDEDSEDEVPVSTANVDVVEAGFSTYEGWDEETWATAAAVLENTGGDMATFFEVIFVFKDEAGKPVGTQATYVNALGAGDLGYTGVSTVEVTGEVAEVEVSAVFDPDGFFFGEGLVVPVTVEDVKPEEYGEGVVVHGIAENTTDQIVDFAQVECALRSEGEIVGYASGFLDTMVAGGSISWTATGPVLADSADCSASEHS